MLRLACLSARVQGGFEMHIHERCRLGGESGGVLEANLGLAGEVRRTKGERRRGQEANLIELPANKPHLWALSLMSPHLLLLLLLFQQRSLLASA